ncbi:dipeptidase [Ktedonosporobacter rubrisoli]|uniref:Dipeptidase n=1 Tax=Ktedonosporobacter rubrisoli TaxID=2509675 RepID=A0A4V0YYP9_KTERU|nr:dipeptidase [Ktedonosporobacter rubrisoli]QBD76981.1 dipeptidase [Ktedonosporobacter rubrisoli]
MNPSEIQAAIHTFLTQQPSYLERLASIPSVAFPGYPSEPVLEAARLTRDLLATVGLQDVRLLDLPGGYPAVYGHIPAPAGAPTILLYAHYDVQPAGEGWSSDPFKPTLKNGRLYGRGAADDKSGIVLHLAALHALRDKLPVGIKVIIEGEEETGAGSLEAYVPQHPELFQADAIIVADSGNWKLGEPTLTTTLRGATALTIEVSTLKGQVHSGLFGGPTPDALMALILMLAKLLDENGDVAVPGLKASEWSGHKVDEGQLRSDAGILEGVELIGTGSISSRLWTKPSISVIGIDASTVKDARNALYDTARAKISLRVPPEQSPEEALELLKKYLLSIVPWKAHVEIKDEGPGEGFAAQTSGPAYKAASQALQSAFGKEVTYIGSGGSIPLINVFANTLPQAEIIIWGAEEPQTNMHAADESVDLNELENMALTEALFLLDFPHKLGKK